MLRRCGPREPRTKTAILKAIVNNRPFKRAEEMARNLLKAQELMTNGEALAGNEYLGVAVILGLCEEDLKG